MRSFARPSPCFASRKKINKTCLMPGSSFTEPRCACQELLSRALFEDSDAPHSHQCCSGNFERLWTICRPAQMLFQSLISEWWRIPWKVSMMTGVVAQPHQNQVCVSHARPAQRLPLFSSVSQECRIDSDCFDSRKTSPQATVLQDARLEVSCHQVARPLAAVSAGAVLRC